MNTQNSSMKQETSYLLETIRDVTSEYNTTSIMLESSRIIKPKPYKLLATKRRGGGGEPVNIDTAVKSDPPPYHQNHIYNQGGGGGLGAKSLSHSFVNSPIHRDISFDDVQQQLIKSLQITPQLKSYINAKITSAMENNQKGFDRLRVTLVEFIRGVNGIEAISKYEDYITRYEEVKAKSETTVISREQLSVDLFKFPEQYLSLSQILLYLSQQKPPLTVIIAKTTLEISLKSIYQDDLTIYDDCDSSTTLINTLELPELSRLPSNPTPSKDTNSSKLWSQMMDYASEILPVKVKKIVYHYTLTVDLALTKPRTVRNKEPIINTKSCVF